MAQFTASVTKARVVCRNRGADCQNLTFVAEYTKLLRRDDKILKIEYMASSMKFLQKIFGMRDIDQEFLSLITNNGTLYSIESLLERGADSEIVDNRQHISSGYIGYTPLHYAANWRGNKPKLHLVEVLIKSGANVNIQSKYGHTALHNFAISGDLDCVNELLAAGASPNIYNSSGHTALHNASQFAHCEVVCSLLNFGADVNAQQEGDRDIESGFTPLHSAIFVNSEEKKVIETVEILLNSGADVFRKAKGGRGETPMERAKNYLELVVHGYNPNEDDRIKSARIVQKIISLIDLAEKKI
jgi:Ankyrin repeats (3 copies)/Ankyrin repeat